MTTEEAAKLSVLHSKWRLFNGSDPYKLYTLMKEIASESVVTRKTEVYNDAQKCAAAMEDELYLIPLKSVGEDYKLYEVPLSQNASAAVDAFCKELSLVGVYRKGLLPLTGRKVLTGFEYYALLYECYKMMYIHSISFREYAKKIPLQSDAVSKVTFDKAWYLKHNRDLAMALNNDGDLATKHFFVFGIYEYRNTSPVFDPLHYGQYNGLEKPSNELYAEFARDKKLLHTSASFDIESYKMAYPGRSDVDTSTNMDWLESYYHSVCSRDKRPELRFGNIISSPVGLCGFKMNIVGGPPELSIQYKICRRDCTKNCSKNCDSVWVKEGNQAGASRVDSSNIPIQCIRIELTGVLSIFYDVVYSVEVMQLGPLGCAMNGQMAGTIGLGAACRSIVANILDKTEGKKELSRNLYPAYLNNKCYSLEMLMNSMPKQGKSMLREKQ